MDESWSDKKMTALPGRGRILDLQQNNQMLPQGQNSVLNQAPISQDAPSNPNDPNDPNDPNATDKQIRWEYEHLQTANMIMFWFAPETLCPITLFEYGKWLVRNKPLFVGCDPQYKRLLDVQVQTALERPFQKVYTSLEEVADSILLHLDRYTETE